MARAKLTALAVERAQKSGRSMLLSDGEGLYLRKQTRDGASWTLRYRFAGKEHWLTLGNYPDMSLSVARIEARQARVLLDKQQNPLSVRRAAHWRKNGRRDRSKRCVKTGIAPRSRRVGSSIRPYRGAISTSICCRNWAGSRRAMSRRPMWRACSMNSRGERRLQRTICCGSRGASSRLVCGGGSSPAIRLLIFHRDSMLAAPNGHAAARSARRNSPSCARRCGRLRTSAKTTCSR